MGRIYQTRRGPDNLRWFWSMTVNGPMTRSGRVAALEEAKAQFPKVGRLEGVGDAGRGAIDLALARPRRRPRQSGKNPAAGGARAGLSTGGSP